MWKKIILALALLGSLVSLSSTAEAAKCIKRPGGGNAIETGTLPIPEAGLLWC